MANEHRPPVDVTVEVDGDELVAGTMRVTERRGQSMTFEYDRDYLADSRAYALDPALLLGTGVFQPPAGAQIFNAFSDSAPDRWGQDLMRRQEEQRARKERVASRRLGPADFLLGTRDDLRQGALRFRDPPTRRYYADTRQGVPALVDLGHLLSESERLAEGGDADADVKDLIAAGSSLGGARPKAAVRLPGGELAIAKFPRSGSDEWDVATWEMVENDLAHRSGISVASAQLLAVGNRKVIVVKRFDRQDGRRVGFASALTMLQAADRVPRSYTDLAEVIEAESNDPDRDLEELFRRLVFSILTSNTDDHLRNHGFLRRGIGWDLAPAYDMNPNPQHLGRLTTAVDRDASRAHVEVALSVAFAFRLRTTQEASRVIGEVERGTREWRKVASNYGIDGREIDLMARAFETEQRAVAGRIGGEG